MYRGWSGPYFLKLCVYIKDNNNSSQGKFYWFLFTISSKFPDLNFAPHVLSIYSYKPLYCSCDANIEPRLPVLAWALIPFRVPMTYLRFVIWAGEYRLHGRLHSQRFRIFLIYMSCKLNLPFLSFLYDEILKMYLCNTSECQLQSAKTSFGNGIIILIKHWNIL